MHSILTSSQGAEFSKDLFLPKSVWFPHSIPGLNVSIPDLSLKTKNERELHKCVNNPPPPFLFFKVIIMARFKRNIGI